MLVLVLVLEFVLFVLLPVLAFLLHAADKTTAASAITRSIRVQSFITTLLICELPCVLVLKLK